MESAKIKKEKKAYVSFLSLTDIFLLFLFLLGEEASIKLFLSSPALLQSPGAPPEMYFFQPKCDLWPPFSQTPYRQLSALERRLGLQHQSKNLGV